MLLYIDLTSTYFESDPPEAGERKFDYSRDKRPDCVQVVITLIVAPEGFPLVYEVMPRNTSDKATLADFLWTPALCLVALIQLDRYQFKGSINF